MDSIIIFFRVSIRVIALIINQVIFIFIGLLFFYVYKGNKNKYWKQTSKYSRYWAGNCCSILNIKVKLNGEKIPPPGSMIVANHVGTADILVLGSSFDVAFVSKLEVSEWPLVGWAARLGATIFIDRSKRKNVSVMIKEISERLISGCSVALFPEGGITDHVGLKPFKPSAFEGAVLSQAQVVPIQISYNEKKEFSVARWTGTSFLAHKLAMIKSPGLEVNITILPSIKGEPDRRVIAMHCYRLINDINEQEGIYERKVTIEEK